MKMTKSPFTLLIPVTSLLVLLSRSEAQTATHTFTNGGGDRLWSNSANWSSGTVPDSSSAIVQLNGMPIVDGDYTVGFLRNNFSASDYTLSGTGTLTIDRNSGSSGNGLSSVTGNTGSTLTFQNDVTINNSGGGTTIFGYGNSSSNGITFDSGSTLTLTTQVETSTDGAGRSLTFNGNIAGGSNGVANLVFGANDENITFGETADNSSYVGDFVSYRDSSVVSNTTVAGGFLDQGSKLQVNGDGASLQLNGEGGMEGNLVLAGNNSFTLDVNANQSNFGIIGFSNPAVIGNITIDLGATVTELFFSDSSSFDWGTNTLTILGFRENTIRFGTDENGLTSDQLSAIDGGAYSLTDQGYLSIPEPGSFGLILGVAGVALAIVSRRRC